MIAYFLPQTQPVGDYFPLSHQQAIEGTNKSNLATAGFLFVIIESERSDFNRLKQVALKTTAVLKKHQKIGPRSRFISARYEDFKNPIRKLALPLQQVQQPSSAEPEDDSPELNEPDKKNIPEPYLDLHYFTDLNDFYHPVNLVDSFLFDRKLKRILIVLKPDFAASDASLAATYLWHINDTMKKTLPEKFNHYIAGRYFEVNEQRGMYLRDISKTPGISLLIVLFSLVMIFRSIRTFFVLGWPILTATGLALVLLNFYPGRADYSIFFLASLLPVTGALLGIPLYYQYKQMRFEGMGLTEALGHSIHRHAIRILVISILMALSFFTLSFVPIAFFTDIAFFASLGIILQVVMILVFLPAMITITDGFSNAPTSAIELSRGNLTLMPVLAVGLTLLAIVGSAEIPFLKKDHNIFKFQTDTPLNRLAQAKLATIVEQDTHAAVFEVESEAKSLKLLNYLRQSADNLTIAKEITRSKKYPGYIFAFLTDNANIQPTALNDNALNFLSSAANLCYTDNAVTSGKNCDNKVKTTGLAFTEASYALIIKDGMQWGFWYFAGVAFIVVISLGRKPVRLVYFLVPLIVAAAAQSALIFLLQWTTNSSLFVISEIHYLSLPVFVSFALAWMLFLRNAIRETGIMHLGRAIKTAANVILSASMIGIINFAALGFAFHQGMASLGLMCALSVISLTISYLFIFPFLVKLVHRKQVHLSEFEF